MNQSASSSPRRPLAQTLAAQRPGSVVHSVRRDEQVDVVAVAEPWLGRDRLGDRHALGQQERNARGGERGKYLAENRPERAAASLLVEEGGPEPGGVATVKRSASSEQRRCQQRAQSPQPFVRTHEPLGGDVAGPPALPGGDGLGRRRKAGEEKVSLVCSRQDPGEQVERRRHASGAAHDDARRRALRARGSRVRALEARRPEQTIHWARATGGYGVRRGATSAGGAARV